LKNGATAKNFTADLRWENGSSNGEKNLNDDPDESEVEAVKYLPQGQFQRLTNEIEKAQDLQEEIEKVVFSHVAETERLGANSFDEYIKKKIKIVESEQSELFLGIESVNKKIIALEEKSTDSYKAELENKLKVKKNECIALEKPAEVSNPDEDPGKKKINEEVISKIEKLKTEIAKLETEKQENEVKKKALLLDLKTLVDAKREIEIKKKEVELFVGQQGELLSKFQINIAKVISFDTNFNLLDGLIAEYELSLEGVREALGELNLGDEHLTIPGKLSQKLKDLSLETAKLNVEQKKYQDYLKAKEEFDSDVKRISGDAETAGTVEFYKAELKYVKEDLSTDLETRTAERLGIVKMLFEKKQQIIATYKDANRHLNDLITANSDTLKDYNINVDASLIKRPDFENLFLGQVKRRLSGTFYSIEGGDKELSKLTEGVDFDDESAVVSFIESLIDALNIDQRETSKNQKRAIQKQVDNIPKLYDYLYKLEFLDYKYNLKQNGKFIEQLSPGERGALLLVFYLLLDKSDIPLILDQPEDNLDNHSVATVLVPFIRAAKKKRQIILVTHNPNLAVVSDAEQVIYVDLDKQNDYTFLAISGSIENKDINEKIVQVLEGAMPAFNKRKSKYYE